MSRLATIRGSLTSLRLYRQGVRWTTALSAVGIALLWSLAAIFVLDFGFERLGFHTTGLQRLVLIVAGAAACVWAYLRFASPLMGVSETDLEMALWVEKQQGIESDLVAALQFESPEAATWGSPQLEKAVVDYVSDWGRGLDVYEGFDRRDMGWRAAILGVSVALAAVVCFVVPGHALAFAQRIFLLSPVHYPSATVVEQVAINGRVVGTDVTSLKALPAPYGQPIDFEVLTSGVDPRIGSAQLRSDQSGLVADVDLKPAGERDGKKVYTGRLPRLLDTVSYQLFLHDAWTNPAEINLVPLPVVKPRLDVAPPAYARAAMPKDDDPHAMQKSVLEGSTVRFSLDALTKPLKSARLTLVGVEDHPGYDLVKSTAKPSGADVLQQWELKEPADARLASPFTLITEPVRFEVQVTDEDGLQLESPLRGSIGIKADRRPQLLVETVNKVVVPGATPVFGVRARDDFGIREMRVLVTIARAAKRGSDSTPISQPPGVSADPAAAGSEANTNEERVEHIARLVVSKEPTAPGAPRRPPMADKAATVALPLAGPQLPLEGWYPLPLAPYKLAKGDQLKVTFEAVDERGALPGETSSSEPIVLEVTDASGIMAAVAEGDERSEKNLIDITNLQLGIGDGK